MAGFTIHRSKSRYDKINTTMAQKGIHWLAPTTVAVALLAGVLFAVGHHLFYASLRGQPVHNDDLKVLGGNISRQQINITAGTIFAFLVNFCLGTALTTAYAQVFWKALLRQRATLETWDAAFSATSNIFFIGKVWVWWHFPLLGAFAIIAWLLPFATTFPPGTLSVGIKRVDPPFSLMQQVPNVDFSSLNYVAPMTRPPQGDNSELNTEFLYKGASTNVQRIANQVAETGVMLPITPPYPNASYALEFYGPSLACSIVPDAIQSSVHKFVISKIPDYCTAEPGVYGYSSWQNGMAAPGLPSNLSSSFSRLNSNGIALNVVAFPHMMELHPGTTGGYGIEPYPKACEPPADPENDYLERVADATMLQCVLRNATYQVTFNYTNAQQSIEISSEAINSNPINRRAYVRGDGTAYTDDVHDGVDCSVLAGIFNDNVDPERICLVDTHILKQLSYQGIFDAFANLFNGSISRPQGADSTTVQTNVQGTILVDTPELSFLNPYSNEDYPSLAQKPLQGYIQGGNLPLFRGLVNNVRVGGLSALPRTMESLFENITISMMSSKTLQYVFTRSEAS